MAKVTVSGVLSVARAEIGAREKATNAQLDDPLANAGHNNFTKYARDLDALGDFYNGPKQGFAYCDVFADWCIYIASGRDKQKAMYVLCQPPKSAGAGCYYSAQYYKAAGRWSSIPQPGAQIFFSYAAGEISHTGLVESVTGSTVTTIEGNTSDMVARRVYSRNDPCIVGYGLPRYDEETDDDTDDNTPATPEKPSEPVVVPVAEVQGVTVSITLPVLRKGAEGAVVAGMQRMLIACGCGCGPDGADGDFGGNTYTAVINFQRRKGLDQDGVCGRDTWTALIKASLGV